VDKEYDSYDGWYTREWSYIEHILYLDNVKIDELNNEVTRNLCAFKLLEFENNKIKYEFESEYYGMGGHWHYFNVQEYNIITKELKKIKCDSLI
jgi:hypothetical protein